MRYHSIKKTFNCTICLKWVAILSIFLLLINSLAAQPSEIDSISFIDYNRVVKDLKLNGIQSVYYTNLNVESLLSLDRSSLRILLKMDPNILQSMSIDTSMINFTPRNNFKIIEVGENTTHQILSSKNLRDSFFVKLSNVVHPKDIEFEKDIYTKENVYILSIYTNFWSETFRLTELENHIKAEFLWGYY